MTTAPAPGLPAPRLPAPRLSRDAVLAMIGETIGVSGWITIDQGLIDGFAACTGDFAAIHVDPAFAATGPFGTTIAHGFLTLSLLARLGKMALPPGFYSMAVNYGLDHVRFVAPVPVGSAVRGRFVLAAAEAKPSGVLRLTLAATVEIAGAERPALVADWVIALLD